MSAEQIRSLNDRYRADLIAEGQVYMTAGINALPFHLQVTIVRQVREFDDFTDDNDPYGEHDFGSFNVGGYRVFWKFDYYDKELQYGSDDPADEQKTERVLTIMLAEEY